MIYNFPNLISLLRVFIAPVYFMLIVSGNRMAALAAFWLFLVGAISDYFDGWYARKYGEVTQWGNFFDPLADKVLTTAAFFSFVMLGLLPLWMVLVVLVRDIGTTLMRIYADSKKMSITTSKKAKLKTFLQMAFIIYLLLMIFLQNQRLFPVIHDSMRSYTHSPLVYVFMLLLTLLTIWTVFEYFFQNKTLFFHFWRNISKKIFAND
jgi:CDP-diacylglycerol---glycerol-3-phosphate 3-phosphatidyltransferase